MNLNMTDDEKRTRALALMTNWQRCRYSRAIAAWTRKGRPNKETPDPVQYAIRPRPGSPLPAYLHELAFTTELLPLPGEKATGTTG